MGESMDGSVVVLPVLACSACGHRWSPRRPLAPKICPKCKSPRWNRSRSEAGSGVASPVERRQLEAFRSFLAVVDPAIVRSILALIETEVRMSGDQQGVQQGDRQGASVA